jgi:polysaccharide biosynthesis/export protein
MRGGRILNAFALRAAVAAILLMVAACSSGPSQIPTAKSTATDYVIGPGDTLNVFVWRRPELSVTIPVRPDGKISVPLVSDVVAAGKTPTVLSHDIEQRLKKFVQDPLVTVMVEGFNGPFSRQVRVIGEAAHPQAIPYRSDMTLLDVMIHVGGLTKFAAGNRAVIVRKINGKEESFPVRLDSLINGGNIGDNVAMEPGDIVIIPQRYF